MPTRDFDTRRYARLYDRMAPFYATGMRLLPVWQRYTEEALPWLEPIPTNGPLLEIGPGPGVLLEKLVRQFDVAVGLDLSTGMLAQAQARLHTAALPARLVQGDAASLPFAPERFAAVVLTFAFSAFPDGLGVMREIARVLRPDGLVVLIDAAEPDDGNATGFALARAWELFGDFMRDEADLMRRAGLQVIERRNFGAFRSIRLTVGIKSPPQPS